MISIVIPTIDSERAWEVETEARALAGMDTYCLIVNDKHRSGFTSSVNLGIKRSKHWDVLLLNDDISGFKYGWLSFLKSTLYSAPDIGMVGPAGDRSTEHTRDWTPEQTGTVDVDHLCFWCVLIRREVIEQIGLLDERYIHYASDFDYCDRARAAGWRCVIDYDVILKHHGAGSGAQIAWRGHDLSLYQHEQRKREGWQGVLRFC